MMKPMDYFIKIFFGLSVENGFIPKELSGFAFSKSHNALSPLDDPPFLTLQKVVIIFLSAASAINSQLKYDVAMLVLNCWYIMCCNTLNDNIPW